jgi:hypothetical protein
MVKEFFSTYYSNLYDLLCDKCENGKCCANKKSIHVLASKETGHLWLYYIYMTVFIRNAANLAHILPKTSRTTFTSEVFL